MDKGRQYQLQYQLQYQFENQFQHQFSCRNENEFKVRQIAQIHSLLKKNLYFVVLMKKSAFVVYAFK